MKWVSVCEAHKTTGKSRGEEGGVGRNQTKPGKPHRWIPTRSKYFKAIYVFIIHPTEHPGAQVLAVWC